MQKLKRILILDDYAALLNIIEEVLEYEHFEVKGIAQSLHLIPAAKAFQPDLIVIDCHLSGADSASICKSVKAEPLLGHIPVIICSSYLSSRSAPEEYGCAALIAKPYNMQELIETVNDLLIA